MDIQEEKKAIKNLKAHLMDEWELTEEQKDEFDNLVFRVLVVGKEEAKAQAVPEGFVLVPEDQFESLNEFKGLYKRAIINAKKRKNQINWAHVAELGVGSGRAVDLCKSLGIDPGATNMHVVIEAREQSHD